MFDISFMELLVISVVALIVIGPERLPAVARTLGNLYGRCRSFIYSVRTDIHNEIRMEELKKIQSSIEEATQSVQRDIDEIKTDITDSAATEELRKAQSSTEEVTQSVQRDIDEIKIEAADPAISKGYGSIVKSGQTDSESQTFSSHKRHHPIDE